MVPDARPCNRPRGEADDVEQERAPIVNRLESADVFERIHPSEAELALAFDRRDVLDRRERKVPFGFVGQVGVEQCQVELDVHRFFEQLSGEVQAGFGCVHVLIQVQYQVVRDDRVASGEERH